MIKLIKPAIEHKEKYKEMIEEWQQYGGPYVPCIVEYDCGNPIDKLDYNATVKVVNDYSNGDIFDYDVDYFESSDFYFIFDEDDLIGVCEIRKNLKKLGKETIGHLACGIRPSKRGQKYAEKATLCMIEKLKELGEKEVIICHYAENKISPKVIQKLGFKLRNTTISKVSNKEIMCYVKKIN